MSNGFVKITPFNGFDSTNPDNAKQNNYAWAMEEMGDYIYVGTGRNIVFSVIKAGTFPGLQVPKEFVPQNVDMNAEIWRYKKDGSEGWQRVYKAPPQLGIIGFRFMIRYTTPRGETALYAVGYTIQPKIVILKSLDGVQWTPLVTDIPGTSTRAMIEHNGKLYMGVLGDPVAGDTLLYVSEDPEKNGWTLVSTQGDPDRNPRGGIVTMVSFNGHIYVGTAPVGGFEVWRTEGLEPQKDGWKLVVDKGAGDGLNEVPLSMGVFKDHIYVGTAIAFAISSVDPSRKIVPPKPFDLIRINRHDEWKVIVGGEPVLPTNPVTGKRNKGKYVSGFGDISNGYCWQLIQFGNRFYLGTWDWSVLLPPFISSLATINKGVLPSVLPSFLNPANIINLVREYNLKPLLKLLKGSKRDFYENLGFDMYVSENGENWKAVTLDGLGNPYNYGLRNLLPSEDGKLYLGTANPFQGCEVWVKGTKHAEDDMESEIELDVEEDDDKEKDD
ncbi:hypothetical protein [Thermosediminibacter litoriperuensis]|uniref:Uncharacterized protein n=1 Tax=Thermosediminibacter litoriperuensis TaxID=291989 RepID=A0A5S5AX19_9FIRM|nr:hypothetical protein [Thermosediminibacter litoriperuensis]TYP56851.1 hypothetical protein LZ11_00914 [Thermosediminibacter litoriperuensis]